MSRRGAVRLAMSKVTQVDFAPKELVSYCKETQTHTEALTHTEQKGKQEHKHTSPSLPFSLSELYFK